MTALMVLCGTAAACSALMPSDDELRGEGGAPSSGGSGGTSGVSGGGGFPTGGNSGQGGTVASCTTGADFSSLALAGGRSPSIAYRSASNDLALTHLEVGDVFTRTLGLDGATSAATKLSTSASATELSASFGTTTNAVGTTWFDSTLMFGAHPPTVAKPVFGTDASLPGGKSPKYAAIAGRPSGAGFGIVWNGYGDSAKRLYAVLVDASGGSLTGGDGYTRITDGAECGDRNHQALVATSSGFAVAWSWAPATCGSAPTGDPDIYFTTLDDQLSAPVSTLIVEAAAGVSDFPALAFSGTDFGIAWLDSRDGTSAVWFARVAGSGVVPGSLVRVSSDVPTANRPPAVAAGAGGYAVAWQSGSTLHFEAIGGADVVLAGDALTGETPSLAWAGDRWAVAWTRAGGELRLSVCAP